MSSSTIVPGRRLGRILSGAFRRSRLRRAVYVRRLIGRVGGYAGGLARLKRNWRLHKRLSRTSRLRRVRSGKYVQCTPHHTGFTDAIFRVLFIRKAFESEARGDHYFPSFYSTFSSNSHHADTSGSKHRLSPSTSPLTFLVCPSACTKSVSCVRHEHLRGH